MSLRVGRGELWLKRQYPMEFENNSNVTFHPKIKGEEVDDS